MINLNKEKPITLYTPTSFLDEIGHEALRHPDTETGGYIFGLKLENDSKKFRIPLGNFTPSLTSFFFSSVSAI